MKSSDENRSPDDRAKDSGGARAERMAQLLERLPSDDSALDEILPLLYEELRGIARRQRRKSPHSARDLNTTSLVHEAYLSLSKGRAPNVNDADHLLAIATRAMRNLLVDEARRRTAQKRGGDFAHVSIAEETLNAVSAPDASALVALDMALDELQEHDERLHKIVECRYFGGLTEDETAMALGVSVRTVRRDWVKARAWLRHQLDTSEEASQG